MAEVGLVRFATIALQVTEATLPASRRKYSKRVFTQPQLLAILCLMRYEDWTCREAEVRVAEHAAWRRVLHVREVPEYTPLSRFLRRLAPAVLTPVLHEVLRRLLRPHLTDKATGAVDAPGLIPGAISPCWVQRRQQHGATWRQWLKWTLMGEGSRRVILVQAARQGPLHAWARLRPLVDAAAPVVPIGRVLADAEVDRERNHQHVRQVVNARRVIPATRGTASWQIHGVRAQRRRRFPHRLYRQRSLVESVLAAVKRTRTMRVPGRSLATQRCQALLVGLAYDSYRL